MEIEDCGAVRCGAVRCGAVRDCPWPDFWEDEGNVSAVAAIAAARAGKPGHFQNFANTFKGRRRFWDVQVTPILGREGLPERLLAVSRDIIGTEEAEHTLALGQERLDLALGASDMGGIWDWDLVSGLLYADARFARFYGVDPERAAAGGPIEEYLCAVHPEDLDRLHAEFRQLFGSGRDYASDYRIVQADGAVRWVSARGKLVHDAQGRALRFPGASMEITARKQAENTVREANDLLETRIAEALAQRETAEEALRQSQKMEAVGQLTGATTCWTASAAASTCCVNAWPRDAPPTSTATSTSAAVPPNGRRRSRTACWRFRAGRRSIPSPRTRTGWSAAWKS